MKQSLAFLFSLLLLGSTACKQNENSQGKSPENEKNQVENPQKKITKVPAVPGFDHAIAGAITFRDNSNIPPSCDIIVRLHDMTAGSKIVRDTSFRTGKTNMPYSYVIGYNDSDIVKGNTYAITAVIEFSGVNMYYTLTPFEVINNGLKNELDMILVMGPKPIDTL